MSEWKEFKFGEVAEIVMGQSPSGETCNSKNDGIPLLNGPTEFSIKYPFPIQFTVEPKKLSKIGDILFCVRGSTTGKMNWSDKQYAIGRGLAAIRHKTSNEAQYFIKGLLDYYLPLILGGATGSTFPNVSGEDLRNLIISAPNISQQISIASIFSTLDSKIELLHRQNKTLKELASVLFKQWFVEEADESWELAKISDVADINSKTVSKNFPFPEIEYLDTSSITNGVIADFQTIALKDAPSRAQRIAEDDDIVYSLVRPIQRHFGLLSGIANNTVVSTGFCVISCKHFSPHFLYILLTKDENVEYFDMIAEASTSTYPSLKPSDIANFEFLKPPEKKLKMFSEIASDTWKKINANSRQIRTLTQLRENLLPKLMSGELKLNL